MLNTTFVVMSLWHRHNYWVYLCCKSQSWLRLQIFVMGEISYKDKMRIQICFYKEISYHLLLNFVLLSVLEFSAFYLLCNEWWWDNVCCVVDIFQFLSVPLFRNITMKCLTEIGKLSESIKCVSELIWVYWEAANWCDRLKMYSSKEL